MEVEKLEKLVNKLDDLVELGEKVFEDGKVDFADIGKAPELFNILKDVYELISKDGKQMISELKDLDYSEVIKLIEAAKN